MIFEEKRFVVANILIKTPTNIIGGGNIMAVQLSKDKLFDFVNYKEYEIINNTNNLKEGVYAQVINRPFKNSNKVISTKIFKEKEFKKYIKEIEKQQKQFEECLNNPEYIQKANVHCSEDSYLYVDKTPKKKVFNKKLP
ncbi:MAG: hypothetical protein IJO32_00910 [Bacilli bacterium]|nr:hypothetical protein [Bacilli bacterium]